LKRRLDGDAYALGELLAAIPEVVVVVDLEGTILYVNRVEAGYEREQVLGVNAGAIMLPESGAIFRSALEAIRTTGEADDYEVKALSPTGETQWYQSRMIALREDDEVVGAVILATNVTELKATRDEVERLRRLLPICSWCDRIQGDGGAWLTIEAHLEGMSGTKVSHGLCPDCHREHLGGGLEEDERNGNVA